MSDYGKILHEIRLLRGEISTIDMTAKTIEDWLPRKFIMKFFDIGKTTIAPFEKTGKLIVSKVGRRKFYSVKSQYATIHH